MFFFRLVSSSTSGGVCRVSSEPREISIGGAPNANKKKKRKSKPFCREKGAREKEKEKQYLIDVKENNLRSNESLRRDG